MSAKNSEFAAKGRHTREALFGKEHARNPRPVDNIAPFLGELSDEANWGRIWSRPGLGLRTRAMCVVVALVSQGQLEYATGHVRGLRNLGMPREELVEVATQLTFYCGLPRVRQFLALIIEVYED